MLYNYNAIHRACQRNRNWISATVSAETRPRVSASGTATAVYVSLVLATVSAMAETDRQNQFWLVSSRHSILSNHYLSLIRKYDRHPLLPYFPTKFLPAPQNSTNPIHSGNTVTIAFRIFCLVNPQECKRCITVCDNIACGNIRLSIIVISFNVCFMLHFKWRIMRRSPLSSVFLGLPLWCKFSTFSRQCQYLENLDTQDWLTFNTIQINNYFFLIYS